jgi:type I protein arginine methyltransferase
MDDYRVSMSNRRRVSMYRDAMAGVVRGRVVCELGVGHVPLGLLALQLGAKRVYAVDADAEALSFAQAAARDNGFGPDQYVVMRGTPATVVLPDRVDMIVAEPLSSMGFCEDTGERMATARARLLAPGGIMVPQQVRCYAALAGPTQFARQLNLWAGELPELIGTPAETLEEVFRSTTQTMTIAPTAILGDWEVWRKLAFDDPGAHRELRPLVLTAHRQGIAHGVACCFEADLSSKVTLRTFPDASPTPWQQAFTPFGSSIRVTTGDAIYVQLMAPEQAMMGSQFETQVLGTPNWSEQGPAAA